MLALNGFHQRVLRSLRYRRIGLTRNMIFAGKVPFPRAGHTFFTRLSVAARRVLPASCHRS